MTKHSLRAKWNTASAKAAQRLMDIMFYGYAVCVKCGKKFTPKAYEQNDLCPACLLPNNVYSGQAGTEAA